MKLSKRLFFYQCIIITFYNKKPASRDLFIYFFLNIFWSRKMSPGSDFDLW